MKEFPRRFLSLRDKNGTHRRSKSMPPGSKSRSSNSDFFSIFKSDQGKEPKESVVDEEDKAAEDAKIAEVHRRLEELHITNIPTPHIKATLNSMFAHGNPERAASFIDIEQKSSAGVIFPYDPNVHMVGAENRGAVTCYLDTVLFSMFSKLGAFECMLKNQFPPEDPRNNLVKLLRIWVNMLRSGKLICVDLTKLIQDALGDCGWSDARMLEQQDTSEAFAFLTETLQLPLLSLQVDLFHHGKRDDDDHKVVYERLLNLAVPPDPENKGVKLEDCLEDYFNAQVDVLRDSEVAKKSISEDKGSADARVPQTLVRRNTIRLQSGDLGTASTAMSASPVTISPTSPFPPLSANSEGGPSPLTAASPVLEVQQAGPSSETNSETLPIGERRLSSRHRSTSIIQSMVLDEKGRSSSIGSDSMLQKARRKGSTVVKAVTIPAWQFFRLIPWHALASNDPQNNTDVATNFDQRPVVGICLKRYLMTASGKPKRHNTFIDIPDSLRLPHFMLADENLEEDPEKLNMSYKLVLQAVICHRGDSVQSGHYIAFSRVEPKILTDNRRHDFDPPPDYEEAQWVQFDDLHTEDRVTRIDDIRKALREEMPYLLFYQVMPLVPAACPSVDEEEIRPPSYSESKASLELPPNATANDNASMATTGHSDSYFDADSIFDTSQSRPSKPPSIRLSLEVETAETTPRKSGEWLLPNSRSGSAFGDSRRPSVAFTDSNAATPAGTPGNRSPIITPSDESTATRLSRAASRFTKGRHSRPGSQSGEGRMSLTMSRLGLTKSGRDPLADSNGANAPPTDLITPGPSEKTSARPSMETDRPHAEGLSAGHKHTHKRGKSKDKGEKTKADGQPDRECVIM